MISMAQYWMGRDKIYVGEFTPEIKRNGEATVAAINELLGAFAADTGIVLTRCASGWRPRSVNAETSNAAEHSLHITANAEDIRDTPGRDFARWCCKNQDKIVRLDLWIERFEWTSKRNSFGEWVSWVHAQRLPPRSGRRFFIPSSVIPFAARLPEQDQFNC